jgi:glucose-6-phosphate dehydrogenase assembly protein OpcA
LIANASIRAIEAELARLRDEAAAGDGATQRTRVLTHVAWVPAAWEQAARSVLEGLGDRHPSRTILLHPDPAAGRDALDASVDLRCFVHGGPQRVVCSEVVTLWLRGRTASAPASVVQPLLVSDLPAFLRWRGELPLGAPELEQLVDVVDRLIVDGGEWSDAGAGYRGLAQLLERVAVSDIAWARTLPWRRALAARWPGIAGAQRLRVEGPRAEALLLSHWLRARLRRELALEHAPAEELERVELDGEDVAPDRLERPSPSDLLSDQLEVFGRDRIYEEALRSLIQG